MAAAPVLPTLLEIPGGSLRYDGGIIWIRIFRIKEFFGIALFYSVNSKILLILSRTFFPPNFTLL